MNKKKRMGIFPSHKCIYVLIIFALCCHGIRNLQYNSVYAFYSSFYGTFVLLFLNYVNSEHPTQQQFTWQINKFKLEKIHKNAKCAENICIRLHFVGDISILCWEFMVHVKILWTFRRWRKKTEWISPLWNEHAHLALQHVVKYFVEDNFDMRT